MPTGTIANRPFGFRIEQANASGPLKTGGPDFNATAVQDLKAVLHSIVHEHGSKSVAELAFELGVSGSYLYRAVETGASGCRFPLDLLLPLIEATADFRVLDYLNFQCQRLSIDMPRANLLGRTDLRLLSEVGRDFHVLMGAVLALLGKPDPSQIPDIQRQLHRVQEGIATIGAALGAPSREVASTGACIDGQEAIAS
jgi:hypothetical protein